MMHASRFCHVLRLRAFRIVFQCAVMTLLLASSALAAPITYTGFTITSGQLGSWRFHNARVFLTFESDTNTVQITTVPDPRGNVTLVYNQIGIARLTIVGDDKTVNATFNQNQIFVSYDQSNGGVGFGSCLPKCSVPLPSTPNLQPAYPLGVSGGTTDAPAVVGLAFDPSPEELALTADLMSDTGLSGRGWACVDFENPDFACSAPTPLMTDKGSLYLFQPYQAEPLATGKVLNAGLFFADATVPDSGFPHSLLAPSTRISSGSITYNVFLVSDVSIGGQFFQNAKIHLSFRSNTAAVKHLPGSGPHAYVNDEGTARVVITKGSTTIKATFDPDQIYVFLDPSTASVGFGSESGGRAYPVTVSECSCNSIQLVGAVSDIINSHGADASLYTSQTEALADVADLTHEIVLADFASSCSPYSAFVPATGICSNLTAPAKLTTDKGDFYLYEPYVQDYSTSPFSNNWAFFWSIFDTGEE